MLDPNGNSASSYINSLDFDSLPPEQQGQIRAALTIAIKGHLIMTAPCPKCGLAKRLFEKHNPDGSIRHECKSCGYLMVWHPRIEFTPEVKRRWRAIADHDMKWIPRAQAT